MIKKKYNRRKQELLNIIAEDQPVTKELIKIKTGLSMNAVNNHLYRLCKKFSQPYIHQYKDGSYGINKKGLRVLAKLNSGNFHPARPRRYAKRIQKAQQRRLLRIHREKGRC